MKQRLELRCATFFYE
uniref:Uncharacterized protein n=1 Tax=Arundo donax TaxID=35708 RepID=A0A0A9AWE8_ARUDO